MRTRSSLCGTSPINLFFFWGGGGRYSLVCINNLFNIHKFHKYIVMLEFLFKNPLSRAKNVLQNRSTTGVDLRGMLCCSSRDGHPLNLTETVSCVWAVAPKHRHFSSGGVGIAHFNMATWGFACGKTPEVRPSTAYVLPYYLKTKSI